MRQILLACLVFGAFQCLVAQTFRPVEGPLLEKEVQFDLANLAFLHFENLTSDSLRLRWRRLEIAKPAEWDIDLCDYGQCYINVPNNGLMNTAPDTATPYFKFIVRPGSTPGVAWLWLRAWEDGNDTNFQDVYFSFHTPGTTAQNAPERTDLQAFPNPTSDFLILKNESPIACDARVFDLLGKPVFEKNIRAGAIERLDMTQLPAGPYFLKWKNRTTVLSKI